MTITMVCRAHRAYDPSLAPFPPDCQDCKEISVIYRLYLLAMRNKLQRAHPLNTEPPPPLELDADITRPRPDQVPWANEVGQTRRRLIDEELDKR